MLGLGITRLLPPGVRSKVLDLASTLRHGQSQITFPPLAPRTFCGDRVVVAGLFSIQCGLQRAADLMVLDFQRRGIRVLRFDLNADQRLRTPTMVRSDGATLSELRAFAPTDIIVHAPPPIYDRFMVRWGRRYYERTRMIAFWHWELAQAPQAWAPAVLYCDELWVPTPFVAEAMRLGYPDARAAIRVVANAVDADPFAPVSDVERTSVREELGIHNDAFVCGFSYAMASGYHRKNPEAAVKAFQEAFPVEGPQGENACFLLRCKDSVSYPDGLDSLRDLIGSDDRIRFMGEGDKVLSLRKFYAALDTVVSLHRSEGYGLILAEALQCGLSVVATGWGLAPELATNPDVHSVGGRLIPVVDPQGLYSAYSHLNWMDANSSEAAVMLRKLCDLKTV